MGFSQLRDGVREHAPRLTWMEMATFYWMIGAKTRRGPEAGVVPHGTREIARLMGKPLGATHRALTVLAVGNYLAKHPKGWKVLNHNGDEPQTHNFEAMDEARAQDRKRSARKAGTVPTGNTDGSLGPFPPGTERSHGERNGQNRSHGEHNRSHGEHNKKRKSIRTQENVPKKTLGAEQSLVPFPKREIVPAEVEKALWLNGQLVINKRWLWEGLKKYYAITAFAAPECDHIRLTPGMYEAAFKRLAHKLAIHQEQRAVPNSTPAKKNGFATRVLRHFEYAVMDARCQKYPSYAERVDQSVASKLVRAKAERERDEAPKRIEPEPSPGDVLLSKWKKPDGD